MEAVERSVPMESVVYKVHVYAQLTRNDVEDSVSIQPPTHCTVVDVDEAAKKAKSVHKVYASPNVPLDFPTALVVVMTPMLLHNTVENVGRPVPATSCAKMPSVFVPMVFNFVQPRISKAIPLMLRVSIHKPMFCTVEVVEMLVSPERVVSLVHVSPLSVLTPVTRNAIVHV